MNTQKFKRNNNMNTQTSVNTKVRRAYKAIQEAQRLIHEAYVASRDSQKDSETETIALADSYATDAKLHLGLYRPLKTWGVRA